MTFVPHSAEEEQQLTVLRGRVVGSHVALKDEGRRRGAPDAQQHVALGAALRAARQRLEILVGDRNHRFAAALAEQRVRHRLGTPKLEFSLTFV